MANVVNNLARELDRVLMEIGNRLRAARHAAGLTQERVAFLADIDYKRYQRVESGEVNVTLRTLVRIADAIQLDFWQAMMTSDEEQANADPAASQEPEQQRTQDQPYYRPGAYPEKRRAAEG